MSSIVQFSTVLISNKIKKNSNNFIIGLHWGINIQNSHFALDIDLIHSISTKAIPSHTFVNAFANFNPRIHILSFLDCAQAGVLKTVQNLFLRCVGSRENVKTKVCIKLFETSILTIRNLVF